MYMNVDELLNNYFSLSEDDKEELCCVLIQDYFRRNILNGYSVIEIIKGIDEVIEMSILRDDFEVSQAFTDIKEAMKIVVKELKIDVQL